MSNAVAPLEHGAWLRVLWTRRLPAFRLFGRFPIGAEVEEYVRTEVVRLYPRSFGFDPMRTSPNDVIRAGLKSGYQYCPEPVIAEIAGKVATKRKGYIVVPLAPGVHRYLLAWTGGQIAETDTMTPSLGGQYWSVLLAKP